MSALLVFASTFVTVFALGVQSLNVNQRMYVAAALTSFFISLGHVALYRMMPAPDWFDLAAYFTGGITGITASIWAHPYIKAWLVRLKAHRPDRAVDEHVSQHFPLCLECGVGAGRPCQRLVCERWTEPTRH